MVRYTKKGRRVVFYASEEAMPDMSNEVTQQHLLVGLLRADESLAARFGLTVDRVPKELTKAPHECRTATGLALSDTPREAILLPSEERNHFGPNPPRPPHLLPESSRRRPTPP